MKINYKKLFTGFMIGFILGAFGFMILVISDTLQFVKHRDVVTTEWRKTIKAGDSVQVYSEINPTRYETFPNAIVDSIKNDSIVYIHMTTKKKFIYKK